MHNTEKRKIAYSVEEAALKSSLGRRSIYEAIGTGELRSFKRGRRRLISDEALREFVANLERESAGRVA